MYLVFTCMTHISQTHQSVKSYIRNRYLLYVSVIFIFIKSLYANKGSSAIRLDKPSFLVNNRNGHTCGAGIFGELRSSFDDSGRFHENAETLC